MDYFCDRCDKHLGNPDDDDFEDPELCAHCSRFICDDCSTEADGMFGGRRCTDEKWCGDPDADRLDDFEIKMRERAEVSKPKVVNRLALKKACNDCPFRRKAAPGWLGADTPEGFIQKTEAGVQMPCHQTVDYEAPDWEQQAAEAPLCAGALIYLANSGKAADLGLYFTPDWITAGLDLVKEGVANIEKDIEHVFQWKGEFLAHHSSKSLLK